MLHEKLAQDRNEHRDNYRKLKAEVDTFLNRVGATNLQAAWEIVQGLRAATRKEDHEVRVVRIPEAG